jgi:hypothetical protein
MRTTRTTFPGIKENTPTGVAGQLPDGHARPGLASKQMPRVWPAVWLYVLVTWLAGGALIELQPWGTWHVMYLSDGALFFALFLLLAIALSVIMAELTRGVSSLPVAGAFHWLINLATLLLLNFASGSLTDITTLVIGFAIAALVVKAAATLRARAGT